MLGGFTQIMQLNFQRFDLADKPVKLFLRLREYCFLFICSNPNNVLLVLFGHKDCQLVS